MPGATPLPEEFYKGIIAISPDAIISVDEAQRILLFNQGAERIFGYTAAEVLGRPLGLLIPEPFRGPHQAEVERFGRSAVVARRMGERGEIRGLRKTGETFPAEASISKLEIEGRRIYTTVLRDVTERHRAEEERERILERERAARAVAEAAQQRAAFLADVSALLDRSLDYEHTLQSLARLAVAKLADVCLIDVADDGRVRRLAAAGADPDRDALAQKLLHYPRRADAPYLTRVTLETGQSVLVSDATREALEPHTQHQEHLHLLLALHPRSYMTVPLAARGRTLGAMAFVAVGEGRRYDAADLAFAEDLAYRAALALDNARLYGAAQRATRARDEVLGIVSHDLRNPLSAISMCASVLEESLPNADESVRYLVETIQRSAEWMNRLIQDLLDISMIEMGQLSIQRRPESIPALLAQLEEMFAAGAGEAGVRLTLDAAPSLPLVVADRERLLQVLANLVANALKFTPAGGEIRVDAVAEGDQVRISVRDTGCGIPPEHLPHLFDRFWQARRGAKERGTGLGLAISKGIVEAHGGRIWVESEVGRGSTFTFVIPLAGAPASGGER